MYFSTSPAPTGMSTLQFSIIGLLISRLAPLSGLPLRFPRRGCAHFLLGLQNTPSSARCIGEIVMLAPSSLKCPARVQWVQNVQSLRLKLLSDAFGYLFDKMPREKISSPPDNERICHTCSENYSKTNKKEKPCSTLKCIHRQLCKWESINKTREQLGKPFNLAKFHPNRRDGMYRPCLFLWQTRS